MYTSEIYKYLHDRELVEKVRPKMKKYKIKLKPVPYSTNQAAEQLQDLICELDNFN